MNRPVLIALAVVLTALGGICIRQWQREAAFRETIADGRRQVEAVTQSRDEAVGRIGILEAELGRISKLRDDAEAKYLQGQAELNALQPDWLARGRTIDALSRLAASGSAFEGVQAAIEQQNVLVKKLIAERDEAIRTLNSRTREWNSLTEKLNGRGR